MIITTVIILTLISLIIFYWNTTYKNWKKIADQVNKVPGPKTYPLIGSIWELINVPISDFFDFRIKRDNKWKPIFREWIGVTPKINIMKADYLEVVLNNTVHLEKGFAYKFLQPWLGTGLLTSTGQRWHDHRKLITPAFHFKILDSFFKVFNEKSIKLVQQLQSKANGEAFNIFTTMSLCTLDIICETAMGVEVNAMDKPNSEYVNATYGISKSTLRRAMTPWLHNDFIFFNLSSLGKEYKQCLQILHKFTNKVIQDRKEYYKNNHRKLKLSDEDLLIGRKNRLAFLDLLIQASDNGKILSDTDIREEVDTFMVEGHDTTTAGICWTLFLLGNHMDIQAKVVEELDVILGDDDRPILSEDLNEMKYLERVIKESLRLYPSVPFISRKLNADVEMGGYKIPKGLDITMNIYETHRDSEQFPNPEIFDPDNFLLEKCILRHPYAYVPFSGGSRNCIGQKFAMMEEKIVIASILRKFKVVSIKKPDEIKMMAELIIRPSEGIFVKLETRK